MKPLTPKQERFVTEYLVDLNASGAALRAGYSPKTAPAIGYENLKKPQLQAAIQREKNRVAERNEVTVDEVIGNLRYIVSEAMAAGQYGPAVKSTELLGKTVGAFVERVDTTGSLTIEIVEFHENSTAE